MSYRRLIFSNDGFYHVFNKSVGREPIFTQIKDLNKALEIIDFYRFPTLISLSRLKDLGDDTKKLWLDSIYSQVPLVKIHAFSLMPNHYHFVLEQSSDKGIPFFLSNFQNSFAKYYNLKHERDGKLFKEMFQAVYLETEIEFTHVCRYVHLNHVTSSLLSLEQLVSHPYSSFKDYMDISRARSFISIDVLTKYFKTTEKQKEFVFNQADYQKRLKEIKRLLKDK